MSDVNPEQEALSGSRILEEMLGGDYVPEPEPTPPPPPPVSTSGGLKPMIDKKRKEIVDLEARLLSHEENGTYQKKGEDGRSYFDYVAMQKDTVRLQQLQREYSELRERDRDFATRASSQAQRAQAVARAYIDKELQKVPQRARKMTAQMFAEIFKGMLERNEWSKSVYADRAAIQSVVEQMFDTAFGSALRRTAGTPEAPSAPSGYDPEDDAPEKKTPESDDDDFTNNLMYAYDRRRRGSMTVAEAKRAALAATQKGAKE